MADDTTPIANKLRALWQVPATRRALIGGGVGVSALLGVGGGLFLTRKSASPVGTSAPGVIATPPTKGIVTFTGKGKAKAIDHIELPLSLVIPSIGVDAPVIAVGLTVDGAMDVPKLASDVAWFEYSPRPGLKGNAILAGHLDWQGSPAVFQKLAAVKSGEPVKVRGSGGDERTYIVEWHREFPAEGTPAKTIFEPIAGYGLTLITCGGKWNPSTRRYDSRVVVRALRK